MEARFLAIRIYHEQLNSLTEETVRRVGCHTKSHIQQPIQYYSFFHRDLYCRLFHDHGLDFRKWANVRAYVIITIRPANKKHLFGVSLRFLYVAPTPVRFDRSLQVAIKTNLLAELKHQAPN